MTSSVFVVCIFCTDIPPQHQLGPHRVSLCWVRYAKKGWKSLVLEKRKPGICPMEHVKLHKCNYKTCTFISLAKICIFSCLLYYLLCTDIRFNGLHYLIWAWEHGIATSSTSAWNRMELLFENYSIRFENEFNSYLIWHWKCSIWVRFDNKICYLYRPTGLWHSGLKWLTMWLVQNS